MSSNKNRTCVDPHAQYLTQMQSLVPTSHCLLLSPGCVQTGAGQWSSVPNSDLFTGVGSSPFSASKPPAIVCRARNEPTQRSIKPGSSQPTVPLTPNCPLSLVRVCVRVCDQTNCNYQISPSPSSVPTVLSMFASHDVMSTCQTV